METTELLKSIHAISGIVVGVMGLLQILLPKHGKRHRLMGVIYSLMWMVLVVTGGLIGHWVVTMLGILGLYMVYTGYRFAHTKSMEMNMLDKVVIIGGMTASAAMVAWSVYYFAIGVVNFNVITLFFGLLFGSATLTDYRDFIQKKPVRKLSGHKMHWYFEHFGRMYVSYIAALTAFSALQNVFGNVYANWMLPTVIGASLLVLTTRYYKKKMKIQ